MSKLERAHKLVNWLRNTVRRNPDWQGTPVSFLTDRCQRWLGDLNDEWWNDRFQEAMIHGLSMWDLLVPLVARSCLSWIWRVIYKWERFDFNDAFNVIGIVDTITICNTALFQFEFQQGIKMKWNLLWNWRDKRNKTCVIINHPSLVCSSIKETSIKLFDPATQDNLCFFPRTHASSSSLSNLSL